MHDRSPEVNQPAAESSPVPAGTAGEQVAEPLQEAVTEGPSPAGEEPTRPVDTLAEEPGPGDEPGAARPPEDQEPHGTITPAAGGAASDQERGDGATTPTPVDTAEQPVWREHVPPHPKPQTPGPVDEVSSEGTEDGTTREANSPGQGEPDRTAGPTDLPDPDGYPTVAMPFVGGPDSPTLAMPVVVPAPVEEGASEHSPATTDEHSPATTAEPEPADAETPRLTACTVAFRSELAALRVLAESFLIHHPYARFVVLLVDGDSDAGPDSTDPVDSGVLLPADIGVDPVELVRLATACTTEELRLVLQPRLLAHLLRTVDGPVLHLDPRVQVFAPLDDLVLPPLTTAPLVLVPRVLEPLPRDGLRPTVEELTASGRYEPGLLAVAPGAESFLAAWAQQAREAPGTAGGFLEGAPALVDHYVLRDPGLGFSVWNAGQRELGRTEEGVLTAAGARLRTVHFAGFDPQRPWLLSAEVADRPRVLLSEHPLVAELCARYRQELARARHGKEVLPNRFEALPDGTPLPAALRREYHRVWLAAERAGQQPPPAAFAPPAPGGSGGTSPAGRAAAEFLEWACAPADERQRATGGSRWTAAVWVEDAELRRRFPDPFGADAAAFREWCLQHGVPAGRVHPEAIGQPSRQTGPELVDQLGIAVLGEGELGRALRAVVRASGLPISDRPIYPVVVRCPGAPPAPRDRYVIELRPDAVPATTAQAEGPDELWVLSEAGRRSAGQGGRVPVRAVVLPVSDPGEPDAAARLAARRQLGLPEDVVVFVGLADHAEERRGNALGLVSAFLAAFSERRDVRLVLLVRGAREYPEAAERLRLATAVDPRVVLVEEERPAADPEGGLPVELIDAADCVVSLHRAHTIGAEDHGGAGERTALLLAAAAVRGVTVLASDHGAVAEWFAGSTGGEAAVLVPCHQGGTEPDLQAAARLLRAVAEDLEGARRVGARGREHVLRTRDLTGSVEQVRERVEQAYRTWRARRSQVARGPADDPLRPLLLARHALHRQPDVDAQSRTPMAPALRKAVLRVLGHYDNHLREVMGALVDGVERTVRELVHRQEQLRDGIGLAELDVLRAELGRLAERQQQLADQLLGTDDGVLRARADLAVQGRRLAALEEALAAESARRAEQVDTLAERLDRLTMAVNRTLDRVEAVEARVAEVTRVREGELELSRQMTGQAMRTVDTLRRVVLREHERNDPRGQEELSARFGPTSLVLCDAGLLRLPAEDSVMLPWLSTNGTWEPEIGGLIDSLMEPGGMFLDVGAYVGYHTLRVLSRIGTAGAVVAVEPCARSAELLRHNVEVNVTPAVAGRLVLVQAAAWDGPGTLTSEPALTGGVAVRPAPVAQPTGVAPSDGAASGGSGALPDGTGVPVGGDGASVSGNTVPAVRLDQELENHPVLNGMRLSVVKVDTPGCGHRALGGLVRLLRRDRPHVICSFSPSAVAALGDDPGAALREFGTWGYDLVPLGATSPISPDDVLNAAEAAGPGSTAMLWLRPRTRAL